MTSCHLSWFIQFIRWWSAAKLRQNVRKDALVAVDGGQRRKYAPRSQSEGFTHKLIFFLRGFSKLWVWATPCCAVSRITCRFEFDEEHSSSHLMLK